MDIAVQLHIKRMLHKNTFIENIYNIFSFLWDGNRFDIIPVLPILNEEETKLSILKQK